MHQVLARERLGTEVELSRMTLPELAGEGVFDAAVYPEGYLDELRREWP